MVEPELVQQLAVQVCVCRHGFGGGGELPVAGGAGLQARQPVGVRGLHSGGPV